MPSTAHTSMVRRCGCGRPGGGCRTAPTTDFTAVNAPAPIMAGVTAGTDGAAAGSVPVDTVASGSRSRGVTMAHLSR